MKESIKELITKEYQHLSRIRPNLKEWVLIVITVVALLVIILYLTACVPYSNPVTVYTPVTIIEPQKAIIEPTATIPIEVPTLYIKDAKVEVLESGIILTFKTTAESLSKCTLIANEKEFYSLYGITPTKEHRFQFGGLKQGLNYTLVISVQSNNQTDKTTVNFVSSNSHGETNRQNVGFDWSNYTTAPRYDGNPSPCANGCK